MIARGHSAPSLLVPAAILLGCVALALRPAALWTALFVVATVGAIGALVPLPAQRGVRREPARMAVVVALGVIAFAAGRALTHPLPVPVTALTVGATVVAAVAEEIFFRRLVYGWLAAAGDAVAILGAAFLFAAVHVPAYGARVLPLDLAAGLIFGWQRWAAGGWMAPALTHAAANVLQLF